MKYFNSKSNTDKYFQANFTKKYLSQPFQKKKPLYIKTKLMRLLLFLSAFLFSFNLFAQDYASEWNIVIQNELDGKTESANKKVLEIYGLAKKDKNEPQVIKCFFYISKFRQVFDEKAQQITLTILQNEIKEISPASKSILYFIYGTILKDYYQYHDYKIKQRKSVTEKNIDLETWSAEDFFTEINASFSKVLENETLLRNKYINEYKDILEISSFNDAKQYSLYDFLSKEIQSYYLRKCNDWHEKEKLPKEPELIASFYGDSEKFVNMNFSNLTLNLEMFLKILQSNEKYYLTNNKSLIESAKYDRFKAINTVFPDKTLFTSVTTNLENNTTNNNLRQCLKTNRAVILREDPKKNSHALSILDSVINSKVDDYIISEAQMERQKILAKELSISLNKKTYANENSRAFITFRNVKNIKLSYFKISAEQYIKFDQKTKDTLIAYTKNKKPFIYSTHSLPDKKDYCKYSTEILLNQIPVGHYLIIAEDTGKEDEMVLTRNAALLQTTNIDYVKDGNNKQDHYFVLDKKTGKPLSNVKVKTLYATTKTDKNGKAVLNQKKQDKKSPDSYIYFTQKKDTLIQVYEQFTVPYSYSNSEDNRKIVSKIYLDRAIYRPGQKAYFKVILFQNKKNIKSTIPQLTIHVTIDDASGKTLKEFDIQTNEFGSFSGEFDIPKNCITGRFSIDLDEPDDVTNDTLYYDTKEDEHAIWDELSSIFDHEELSFKVEEYKRPSFEIKFDTIKENYTIGDTVKVIGHAKSLAGSNITNATVKYNIDKNITTTDQKDKNKKNAIIQETKTDKNGEFIIAFNASDDEFQNNNIDNILFNIDVDVIDSNGETQSSTTTVDVNQKTLKLGIDFVFNENNRPYGGLYKENKNSIKLEATTYNNYSVDTKGELQIFRMTKKHYLKERQFDTPSAPIIPKSEFEKLFPHEPYDNEDSARRFYNDFYSNDSVIRAKNRILVKTITFNTKENDKILLENLDTGDYISVAKAEDSKGNWIQTSETFEMKSINKPQSAAEVFTYKIVKNKSKDKIAFEFYSVLPRLYITVRKYIGLTLDEIKVIEIKNGKGYYVTSKSNDEKNNSFHFSTLWENKKHYKEITLSKEIFQKYLAFEILSFRNKVEPGSTENWLFKVKDNKLEAEVLASMYDTSLDQFANASWEFPQFNDNFNSPNYPYTYDWRSEKNVLDFHSESKKTYYYKFNIQPKLNWFGFNFTDTNSLAKRKYNKAITKLSNLPDGSKQITGIISDATGPIPGANVVVEGTTRGVQTDFDGAYSIFAKEGEKLVYSFMGMIDVVKTVGSTNVINTVLKEDTQQLKEMVVTSVGYKKNEQVFNPNIIVVTKNDKDIRLFNEYKKRLYEYDEDEEGIMKRKSAVTSSYSTVHTSEIQPEPSSPTKNEKALIVIDGEIQNLAALKQIPQDDITSITILTEKEATNLYGEKGKNGVILISTKTALKDLEKVKARKNFNETAFFYPHLKTDTDGKISFNFTTPESLTRWRLRLFGHNKNAEVGYFETEIISQKEIMVMPNMPRFFRENDTITLSAKVVNMTNEAKSGTAMLQLMDAATGNTIDVQCQNIDNAKNFICKPKESVAVKWIITIPEGAQGIQYKVVAKSGNFSDGEENIIPVLTNKILVTESIPIWVREKTKKEFVLENLKNNNSKTLKNHLFTFEYTSNPAWFALQSLPYLMEYEHECAEQTFARYYANFIASQIINSNPKIVELFESWKNENKKSRLEMNEELKSVILQETPWLLDADEEAKNKHLAYLFDLKKLKDSSDEISKKLKEKQSSSGGFVWFDGGSENLFITQHILSGIGHLNSMFPNSQASFDGIIATGIPYIDKQFAVSSKNKKIGSNCNPIDLHYLYTRSLYTKSHPLNDINKKAIGNQLVDLKTNWLEYNLYQKAQMALIFNRFGEKEWAKKIITHFKETASHDTEKGMYWIANKNSFNWYESPIETQVLIIEAFSEIGNDKNTIDALKIWLIKNKQTNRWATTKATTEAIYALLLSGTNWLEAKNNTVFKIGDEKILQQKLVEKEKEIATGYIKLNWKVEEISKKMASITVENKSEVPGFGGAYWQYFENLENIKTDSKSGLSVQKDVFKKVKDSQGEKLIPIKDQKLVLGDVITFRLIIKTDNDLEFVHLKDLRASCFEPVDVISEYKYDGGLRYYKSTKDVATHFFFDNIKKGTYVLEYDVRVNNQGSFNNGIATLQSMYAPEFSTHSTSTKIKIAE